MKIVLAVALAVSAQAWAVNAPTKKGLMNLDSVVTPKAKALGIQGTIPMAIDSAVGSATVAFAGYSKAVVCVEYGEEEIPSHPETAPCLKEETRWIPQANMTVTDVKTTLSVGELKVDVKTSPKFSLAWNCIANLADITVVGDVKPEAVPTVMTIKPGCYAFSYAEVSEKALRPKALKGYSMEGRVDVTVVVPVSSDLQLRGDRAETFEVVNPRIDVGTMFDFGGYRTKIFQYYDRVLFY